MTARTALVALALLLGGGLSAEELPPLPAAWFNDYAGLVSSEDARRLDDKLRRLDEETSTQVVVAIFPKLPSPSLEDFTVRTAESWRVGRGELDNGAILFLFVEDRAMRIEVGYGLEGALPDALARRILDEQVAPRFRRGDWAGGLEAGIDAIVGAVRGEYDAPPAPGRARERGPSLRAIFLVALVIVVLLLLVRFGSPGPPGRTYGRGGWARDRRHWGSGYWGGGSSWGGGGWGGGFGGGGGFSGGGGSFGGGGASSSW